MLVQLSELSLGGFDCWSHVDMRPLQFASQVGTGGSLPGSCGSLPNGYSALPSARGALPSVCGSLPSASGTLTDACGSRPSVCGPLPSACGPMPSASGPLPSACGPLPSASGTLTDARGALPSASGPRRSACGSMSHGLAAQYQYDDYRVATWPPALRRRDLRRHGDHAAAANEALGKEHWQLGDTGANVQGSALVRQALEQRPGPIEAEGQRPWPHHRPPIFAAVAEVELSERMPVEPLEQPAERLLTPSPGPEFAHEAPPASPRSRSLGNVKIPVL